MLEKDAGRSFINFLASTASATDEFFNQVILENSE
jgi:hypothetical protein